MLYPMFNLDQQATNHFSKIYSFINVILVWRKVPVPKEMNMLDRLKEAHTLIRVDKWEGLSSTVHCLNIQSRKEVFMKTTLWNAKAKPKETN